MAFQKGSYKAASESISDTYNDKSRENDTQL
jgi:hypothetical protein